MLSIAAQAPIATRDSLAKLSELPAARVRVRRTPLGRAFGGKVMIVDPLVAAAAALVPRRPVRLALTRSSATTPTGTSIRGRRRAEDLLR